MKNIKDIKQQFMKAVRILSMDDEMIMKFANRVPEKSLPKYPGGVAIEFVAVFEKLLGPCRFRKFHGAAKCASRPATSARSSPCGERNRKAWPAKKSGVGSAEQLAIAA